MPSPPPPADDGALRRAFAKEGRLYGLAVACAVPGALAVWLSDSFWVGALVFLAVLGVAGSGLWVWERRIAARRQPPADASPRQPPPGPSPRQPRSGSAARPSPDASPRRQPPAGPNRRQRRGGRR